MKRLYVLTLFLALYLQSFETKALDSLSTYTLQELHRIAVEALEQNKTEQAYVYTTYGLKKKPFKGIKEDSVLLKLRTNLVKIYAYRNELDKAIVEAKRLLNQCAKVFSKEDIKYAKALSELAYLYYDKGDYESALMHLKVGAKIEEAVLGKEDPSYTMTLSSIATLQYALGNYKKATLVFEKLRLINAKVLGEDNPDYGIILINLGASYLAEGRYDEALLQYEAVQKLRAKTAGKDSPDYADVLSEIGILHYKMGNYELSVRLFTEALQIYKNKQGTAAPLYALTLSDLAQAYNMKGDFPEAIKRYKKALKIAEETKGKEHPDYALILNNLATAYSKSGKHTEAMNLFKEALVVWEKKYGVQHKDYINTLNNIAVEYESLKAYAKAKELYAEVEKVLGEIYATDHVKYIHVVNHLIEVSIKLDDEVTAKQLVQQNVEALASISAPLFSEQWVEEIRTAKLASNQHLEKLIKTVHLSTQLVDKSTKLAIQELIYALIQQQEKQTFAEADKLLVLEQKYDFLVEYLNLLDTDKAPKGFLLAEQNKSALLFAATKSAHNKHLHNLPDTLKEKEENLIKRQAELESELLQRKTKEEQARLTTELSATSQALFQFKKEVEATYPAYAALKSSSYNLELKKLQEELPADCNLIEYVVTDTALHIFSVSKEAIVWKKQRLSSNELNAKIESFHNILSDYRGLKQDPKQGYTAYSKLAYWMYQALLEPVLKNTNPVKKLIIIPDGNIGHLPFEAFLKTPASTEQANYGTLDYLLNSYSISYNYSAGVWHENRIQKAVKNNGKILGVAANYNLNTQNLSRGTGSSSDLRLRKSLVPLPAARAEIEVLQKNYIGDYLFDETASEAKIKEIAKEYSVLHFAVHGLLDKKHPVLSRLAFTEDKDTTENGFWQAYEIAQTQLNADLVVLSACETGLGRFEQGNGMASLARAFMYANAHALIVSLWQVNDGSTAILMERLYANLEAGMAKDEALRQAKLQYIQQTEGVAQHPALWSAFIQMGNAEPLDIKKKRAVNVYVLAAAALLLILGLIGLRYKG